MKLILSIALRNLLRQKRRNILLGAAIAFGTMILIVANSFSHGITETLFNRIVRMTYGHVNISATENGNFFRQIVHEGDRVKRLIRKNNPEVTSIQEGVGVMGRAIGNGKSDNVYIVGVNIHDTLSPEDQKEYNENFKMIEGRFEDIESPGIANPMILSKEKADYLNVKIGDAIRMRFQDINGQNQAAAFTVAGIFKPTNIFMAMPVFADLKLVKQLTGYKPYEAGQLLINMKRPQKEAAVVADRLQKLMTPDIAVIGCSLAGKKGFAPALILGFKSDTASLRLCRMALPLSAGKPDSAFSRHGAVISESLSRETGLVPGDTCVVRYASRYDADSGFIKFILSGVRPDSGLDSRLLLVNERDFFKAFYRNLPAHVPEEKSGLLPDSAFAAFAAITDEWTLLRRISSSEDLMKLYKEIARNKWRSTMVSVSTMYEGASAIIKLEYALNLITFVCVMVLFFIILIGVVNTLRMTIRERTREIGTIRAIGMQKKDVRNTFIAETVFLALFASAAGTALAFFAMRGLSLMPIDAGDNPMGMLLVNGHLVFVPTVLAVTGYNALIWVIAGATAFFPARKAANLSACEALRHYE
jgi:ABC-type lipoprotein release transport system permease subunit